MDHAGEAVERPGTDRVAGVRLHQRPIERVASGQAGVQPGHIGGGHHHASRFPAREVEHSVQHLLLRARDHASALGVVDRFAEFLR